ncbi:hypothetical protein ACFQPF_05465 [Fictibacillus iocasae]|uniref:Lipoprotein n=1 Tax=Fictibacillus iocasae TaxID=2715437 RepID=A0ABW2NPP3_9BACL
MKKLGILLLSAVLILFVSGCSDPVADELLSYVNDTMPSLSEKETEVIELYASVTGPNYSDDETMYVTLTEEVIPQYSEFLADLEKVQLENEEIQKLHEDYIEGVQLQHSGMLLAVAALEEQSFEKMDEANQKLSEGRKKIRDYQQAMKKLAKEHNVKLETKE